MPTLDFKTLWPIVAALFVGAGGASSYFVSRGESEARASLAASEVRVELSACSARLDLTTKATEACSAALDLCAGGSP